MITATLALGKVDLPAGKTPGFFQVTMSFPGAVDVVQTSADGVPMKFDATAPGTYTFVAVRLATDGTDISPLVSASIDVPKPVVGQFDAPVSITLALS